MRSFKGVPGFSLLFRNTILSAASEWLFRDCILHLHLHSNFKASSLLTLFFLILICHYSLKVL